MIKKIYDFLLSWMGGLTILSLIYSVGAIYILLPNLTYLFYFNLSELSKIGGFLSGVFSPLAFLWLVIGYFMQDKAIKNSMKQTNDSIQLNKDQFTYQKEKKTKEDLDNYNNAQPLLGIEAIYNKQESTIRFIFNNYGAQITQLYLYLNNIDNSTDEIFISGPPIMMLTEGGGSILEKDVYIRPDYIQKNKIVCYPISFYDAQRNRQETQLRVRFYEEGSDSKLTCYIDQTRRLI
jgi:hypothetical protein